MEILFYSKFKNLRGNTQGLIPNFKLDMDLKEIIQNPLFKSSFLFSDSLDLKVSIELRDIYNTLDFKKYMNGEKYIHDKLHDLSCEINNIIMNYTLEKSNYERSFVLEHEYFEAEVLQNLLNYIFRKGEICNLRIESDNHKNKCIFSSEYTFDYIKGNIEENLTYSKINPNELNVPTDKDKVSENIISFTTGKNEKISILKEDGENILRVEKGIHTTTYPFSKETVEEILEEQFKNLETENNRALHALYKGFFNVALIKLGEFKEENEISFYLPNVNMKEEILKNIMDQIDLDDFDEDVSEIKVSFICKNAVEEHYISRKGIEDWIKSVKIDMSKISMGESWFMNIVYSNPTGSMYFLTEPNKIGIDFYYKESKYFLLIDAARLAEIIGLSGDRIKTVYREKMQESFLDGKDVIYI